MNNTELIGYAADRLLRYHVKQAALKMPKLPIEGSNLILPGVGAAAGGLYSLLTNSERDSLKEKLKRLLRNTAIGASLGTGMELGRVGVAQKLQDKLIDAGSAAKDLIHKKTAGFYKKKMAGISPTNLILPGVGAGVSSIATLLGMRGTKASLKDKLKRLIRNAALGATVGTGLELGRVGIKGLMSPKEEIDGGAIVDSNFVDE